MPWPKKVVILQRYDYTPRISIYALCGVLAACAYGCGSELFKESIELQEKIKKSRSSLYSIPVTGGRITAA